jgi:hypothetical protein
MLKCCCLTGLGICVVAALVARYMRRRRGLIDGSMFWRFCFLARFI